MDLMRMVDKMPAFPASVQRVVELTSDIQCNPKDLVNALDHDPVLTAKILKWPTLRILGWRRKSSPSNMLSFIWA